MSKAEADVCSAEMLVNLDSPWVILGHSERRSLLNESNEVSCVTWHSKHLSLDNSYCQYF
jgi:triosephosphate isomerase